jgi:hypothetical protein
LRLRFSERTVGFGTGMAFLKSEEGRAARARLEDERRRRDENPPRRFEYTVLRVGSKARAEGPLNELGSKGWQLVQAVEMEGHLAFYLEREIFPFEAGEAEAEAEAEDTGEVEAAEAAGESAE